MAGIEGQKHPNGTIVYYCGVCGNCVDVKIDGRGACEECSATYTSSEVANADIIEVA